MDKALNKLIKDFRSDLERRIDIERSRYELCFSSWQEAQKYIEHLKAQLATTIECYNKLAAKYEVLVQMTDTIENEDMDMKL